MHFDVHKICPTGANGRKIFWWRADPPLKLIIFHSLAVITPLVMIIISIVLYIFNKE